MQDASLPLRDIHAAVAPPWWPPAPGWWGVLAGLLLLALAIAFWRARRRRRRNAVARLFDDALAHADSPAAQIAAMSTLLRRAARRRDPHADTLEGDDWLRFLDAGLKQPVFAAGAGGVLRDGGYRRDVTEAEVEGLRAAVRTRFFSWMGVRA